MFQYFIRSIYVLSFLFCFSFKTKAQLYQIAEIKIIGNQVTKENIITRELLFKSGDEFEAGDLDKKIELSKNNLYNTFLFNFVTIEKAYFNNRFVTIIITVEERWYLWPVPIVEIEETNFNTWWQNKDFGRLNYGFFLAHNNFRGRKEKLYLLAQTGFTQKFGVKHTVPFINKKQTQGTSFTLSYATNKTVAYNTANNERLFIKSTQQDLFKHWYAQFNYQIRKGYFTRHLFELDFNRLWVADSIVMFNKDYITDGLQQAAMLSLSYSYRIDRRDDQNYPLKGWFVDLEIVKDGLGILSSVDGLYINTWFKRFFKLSDRWFFSTSLKNKYTIKQPPYFLQNGFGFGNSFVRGYELNVIDGQDYALLKNQLRWNLLQPKVVHLKALPFNKFNKVPLSFYLGSFFDVGYIVDDINPNNTYANSTLYGYGLALDFVTYYNMVFRMEYTINNENKSGIFIHLIAPI
ncbi:MAG: hypothetical protein Kow0079_01120 [Vicingaceae bacterium]